MAKKKTDTSFNFGANATPKPKFSGAPKSSSKGGKKSNGGKGQFVNGKFVGGS